MGSEIDPRSWWDAEVAPLRAELASQGCVHLDTLVFPSPGGVFACADMWLHGGSTFIDLIGNCVTDRPVAGIAPGFAFIQFRTWKDAGNGMSEVYSAAERVPAPRAYGLSAGLVQRVVAPLFQRLLSPEARAFPLHNASELPQALSRHLAIVARMPGTVVCPSEPALECRFRWQAGE